MFPQAVHDPDAVIYELAAADEDGGVAGGTTAGGKDGVGDGFAAVEGDDGGEAEGFGG